VKKPTKPTKPRMRSREIDVEAERLRRLHVPLPDKWYIAAGELAARLGMPAGAILEMFAEMAHVYAYESPRDEAERRAWRDTAAILESLAARRAA
jgi:hypothetical protein